MVNDIMLTMSHCNMALSFYSQRGKASQLNFQHARLES